MAATRAAVRSALAYPIMLAVAGTASISILVGVVLPKFALLLGDLNHGLPRSTTILMSVPPDSPVSMSISPPACATRPLRRSRTRR